MTFLILVWCVALLVVCAIQRTGRHRHSLLYTVYLRSPLWRLRRRVWILHAGGRCENCRRRRRPLSIHHRNYVRLGREHRTDVEVLCWPCHRHRDHARTHRRGSAPRPNSRRSR